MSRGDGDFLARWSARKQKARTEPDPTPEPEVAPEQAALAPVPEEGPGKTDEEILRELGLPDPDSLTKGDSVAGFLQSGVPARLRNRALKRLWLTDPVFANLDGLNDYEEDFTDAATVVKDLKTAYRVGRGFLRDEPDEAAPEAAAETPQDTGPEEVAAGEDVDAADPEAASDSAVGVSDDPAGSPEKQDAAYADARPDDPADADDAEPAEEPLPPLRRMRFRFDAG